MTVDEIMEKHRSGELQIICTRCGATIPRDKNKCVECHVEMRLVTTRKD